MVSLLAGAFGSRPVKKLLPCIHALAYMHTAVVHQGALDDLVARGRQQAGDRRAEKVIADVPEMQGLVGIGRRELHHYGLAGGGQEAILRVSRDTTENLLPVEIAEREIETTPPM